MKRLLWIFLAMAMLAGCGTQQEPAAPTEPTAPILPPLDAELYVPDSAIEQQTGGAVRVYALGTTGWFGISGMDGKLLLTGENAMVILSGEKGQPVARELVDGLRKNTEMDTYASGTAYYAADTRQVTVLGADLQQTAQLTLPDNVVGQPVISLIRNEVYFFNGTEIRAMNLSTGISRLLRQQSNVEQLLPEDYFDGNVLSFRFRDSEGVARVEYFSSEDGQTFSREQAIDFMHTVQDRYFIRRMDGQVRQMIFGLRDGTPKSFQAPEPEAGSLMPVLEMDGVVSCAETENGLQLSYYNLTSGKCEAKVLLAGVNTPSAIYSDGTDIWLLATEADAQNLFRWNITKSSVEEEMIYTGTFYTPENPDTEGLQACQAIADSYFEQYGLKVNIWQNAVAVTGGHTVETEYHPSVIRENLNALQPALEAFPSREFLQKTVEAGWIQVCFVRSIDSGEDWVHFWQNSDCWILISAQADVEKAFTQAVAYAIDSHVLGNSRDFDFDRWNPLNPEGFTYANSYDVVANPEYLTGETRAFTDALAMSYIHEDRCRIFYHAMLENNAEMFASATMQAKLYRLCIGIREAYGLQKSTDTYAWEQYLNTSLRYGS